jgi:hypothetical protein
MKLLHGALVVVLLAAFLAAPAGAVTVHHLTIMVSGNGDAQVDVQYDLNWLEQAVVFTRIADPGTELTSALETNFDVTVDVTSVDTRQASVLVQHFAAVDSLPGGTRYVTPELSFGKAQRALNRYWFAPFVSADFSPDVTRIVFPDGYSEEFYNQMDIPSISHTTGI